MRVGSIGIDYKQEIRADCKHDIRADCRWKESNYCQHSYRIIRVDWAMREQNKKCATVTDRKNQHENVLLWQIEKNQHSLNQKWRSQRKWNLNFFTFTWVGTTTKKNMDAVFLVILSVFLSPTLKIFWNITRIVM